MFATLRLQSRRPFKLTMFTGTDCQLCQVMEQEIAQAARTVPIELSTYNIRDNLLPDVHTWRRKYQYDIPVLHLEDKGKQQYSASVIRKRKKGTRGRRTNTKVFGGGALEIFRHRVTAAELVAKLQESAQPPERQGKSQD